VSVSSHGSLIALAEVAKGELRPRRIFQSPARLMAKDERE